MNLNRDDYIGVQAVASPHLPAGTYPALVVDSRVYVARFHEVAWKQAGRQGVTHFYGFAEIDSLATVVKLFQ